MSSILKFPWTNNESERRMRVAAVARKNFYGSGSLWSGQLTAVLFSIFQTLGLWNINPRLWLTDYLEACASNQQKAPDDLTPFLPWEMSEEKRNAYALDPEPIDSS